MSLTKRSDCGAIGCGPQYAARLKKKHQGYGDTLFIDEVFIRIGGKQHYLWRAVDQDGEVVDVFLQEHRDGKAAKRFFRRLLSRHQGEPRVIIGWSMKSTLAKEIVLDALLMAIWRRSPKQSVIIHSDQGSQYASDEWQRFCRTHNLVPSMSRRGNCYDNAAVESFFSSLKKEKIRRHIFKTRAIARAEIFDYIEAFYNRARRHQHLGNISPVAYEQQMVRLG